MSASPPLPPVDRGPVLGITVRGPWVRRIPPSPREAAFTLAVLLPLPLWLEAGGPYPLYVGPLLLVAAVAGGAIRRAPAPLSAVAPFPVGVLWVLALVALPESLTGLLAAFGAGAALLLYASLPSPDEFPSEAPDLFAQASVPVLAGALTLMLADTLFGYVVPVFVLVLAPTLGALGFTVYLLLNRHALNADVWGISADPGAPTPPGKG